MVAYRVLAGETSKGALGWSEVPVSPYWWRDRQRPRLHPGSERRSPSVWLLISCSLRGTTLHFAVQVNDDRLEFEEEPADGPKSAFQQAEFSDSRPSPLQGRFTFMPTNPVADQWLSRDSRDLVGRWVGTPPEQTVGCPVSSPGGLVCVAAGL